MLEALLSTVNPGITAGKISIHPVINDIESLCATNCKMAGISLELPKFSEPIFAISSYSELVQVLFILISNAFDEISKNKENLWIKVEIQENKQDGFLEISVTDSGKGIPKDVQEKIFSPFFSTKGTKGSGLGLSVARRLVESHQGKLYLDSSSPNTRFVIRLHSADAYAASSLPVLVIDDESAVIEVITKAFSNRLVPTLSANNGEQALDLIYRHSFRAIVTDLRMPGLDGIGLLERLKKFNFPLPPVFVISGFYSNKMPEVLKAIPIRQFYEKPVNLEKLITDVIEAS
jgi:CheY-like chemotaxis protein